MTVFQRLEECLCARLATHVGCGWGRRGRGARAEGGFWVRGAVRVRAERDVAPRLGVICQGPYLEAEFFWEGGEGHVVWDVRFG
jgi:hypothetical protein